MENQPFQHHLEKWRHPLCPLLQRLTPQLEPNQLRQPRYYKLSENALGQNPVFKLHDFFNAPIARNEFLHQLAIVPQGQFHPFSTGAIGN